MSSNEQASYDDFMRSTGFGTMTGLPKQPGPKPGPNASSVSTAPNNYANANSATPMLSIPGTEYGGPPTPGHMKPSSALMGHPYKTPYPDGTVVQDKSSFQNQGPTQQKRWEAVGLGPEGSERVLTRPASDFKNRKGPEPGQKGVLSFVKEYQTGVDYEKRRTISIVFIAVFGLCTIGFGGKWCVSDRNSQYLYALLVSLVATGVSMGFYFDSDKKTDKTVVSSSESQQATGMGFGRKALQQDNLPPGAYPIQRDQRDPKVYQNSDDPNDTFKARMDYQGTNTNTMEGPRSQLGYRRSPPAPDGRPVLKASELMRDVGAHNMDSGTFEEFMRRMDGEAPNQFVQRQPYYTFNANWENRGQIDDASTVHGISTAPGQMMRKAIYKDPKIQQAGAKTMHLKDPPPGEMGLQKVHPWMEKDESGEPPSFMVSTPANNTGLSEHQTGEGMALRDMIDSRARENNAMIDMNQKKPDDIPEFLKPQETMSDRKKNILSGGSVDPSISNMRRDYGPSGPGPDEPIDVNTRRPTPDAQEMKRPGEQVNDSSLHSTGDDNGFDEHVTPSSNSFEGMFQDKGSATAKEIEEAQLDVRR